MQISESVPSLVLLPESMCFSTPILVRCVWVDMSMLVPLDMSSSIYVCAYDCVIAMNVMRVLRVSNVRAKVVGMYLRENVCVEMAIAVSSVVASKPLKAT